MTEKKPINEIHLRTHEEIFRQIMSNGRLYTVPRFQRDYSWEEPEWSELWEDIENIEKTRDQHFMGYMVLRKKEQQAYEVIDGQQRLVTISVIFLAALARLQQFIDDGDDKEANEERKRLYEDRYIRSKEPGTLNIEYRLKLNRNNNAHYRELVRQLKITQQLNVPVTNRNMDRAFKFFEDRFKSFQDGARIVSLLEDTLEGLIFTIINVDNHLQAYTIFETINARGVQLSTSDLLKNYLMSLMSEMECPDQIYDDFEDSWHGILNQIGRNKLTNFLRSYEGMTDKLRHKKELYKALKKRIDQPEKVEPYMNDIKAYSAVYAALQAPSSEFWNTHDGVYKAAAGDLEVLAQFNIRTPLSVLMAAYGKLEAAEFLRLLKYIAIISIRYNVICNKLANEQEARYNDMAIDISQGKIAAAKDLLPRLKKIYPDEEEFTYSFSRKSFPGRQSAKKAVFLLSKIEHHLSSARIDPSSYSLEHILPYTPNDAWQEYFGMDTYNEAIDRLGNMALLPAQQNMGQEAFEEKQERLQNSGVQINQHITMYKEWDISSLESHQKWLADQAQALWSIEQLEG